VGKLPNVHYDAYLTGKVQELLYPDGEVWKLHPGPEGTEVWVLRRGEVDIGLGPSFKAARASINKMIKNKNAKEFKEKHGG
jgi:hypothetical protein